MGTHRASKDAYDVITHNYYDAFANLTEIRVFNEHSPNVVMHLPRVLIMVAEQ